jgi:protein TonB
MQAEGARVGLDARGSLGHQRATRLQLRRQAARERIHARVAHAIDTPHLMGDPLEHSDSALRSTLSFARVLVIAAILHGLILAIIFLGNALIGKGSPDRPPERMQVRIIETRPPPPPPPPEELRVDEPKIVVPVEPRPAEAKPKVRQKRPPQTVLPDPVRTPPVEAPAAPIRRVVGIDMASTVEGGQGPAFAVGGSRMGETGDRAADPKAERADTQEVPVNRVSTRFAEGDAPVVPPRRLAPVDPEYPPLLREQGIEADVVVVVSIDTDGHVTKVDIVNPALQTAFNDAAVASAKREHFAPATRGGAPVPYTQRYTIRFRLND